MLSKQEIFTFQMPPYLFWCASEKLRGMLQVRSNRAIVPSWAPGRWTRLFEQLRVEPYSIIHSLFDLYHRGRGWKVALLSICKLCTVSYYNSFCIVKEQSRLLQCNCKIPFLVVAADLIAVTTQKVAKCRKRWEARQRTNLNSCQKSWRVLQWEVRLVKKKNDR